MRRTLCLLMMTGLLVGAAQAVVLLSEDFESYENGNELRLSSEWSNPLWNGSVSPVVTVSGIADLGQGIHQPADNVGVVARAFPEVYDPASADAPLYISVLFQYDGTDKGHNYEQVFLTVCDGTNSNKIEVRFTMDSGVQSAGTFGYTDIVGGAIGVDVLYLGILKISPDAVDQSQATAEFAFYDISNGFLPDEASLSYMDSFSFNPADAPVMSHVGIGVGRPGTVVDNVTVANDWTDVQASLPPRGIAHTPVPSGSEDVDSTLVDSVSWYSPEQDKNGDFADDPNIVSVDNYDLYFYSYPNSDITADPNLADPNFADLSPVQTSLDQFMDAALAYDSTYFWRVDTHITWDSDKITGNLSDIITGKAWIFSTLPEYVEPVLTFDNVMTVMDLLPDSLSAAVTGNSDPITSVNFTLLENDFEFPKGANAALTDITTDMANPTATLVTDMPGMYKIRLVISDGMTEKEKLIEVKVYSDACQAKKDSPGGWTAGYYDRDDNCIVDLLDFEEFAREWLDNTAMQVQESYTGDVLALDADIYIEAENVYEPNNPEYVTEAPLEAGKGNPRIYPQDGSYGGAFIGYTAANHFLTYEIDVPASGTYTVYVLNSYPEGTIPTASFGTKDDPDLYGTVTLSAGTGWNDWKADSGTLTFDSAGTYLVRLTLLDAAFNIDFIALKKD